MLLKNNLHSRRFVPWRRRRKAKEQKSSVQLCLLILTIDLVPVQNGQNELQPIRVANIQHEWLCNMGLERESRCEILLIAGTEALCFWAVDVCFFFHYGLLWFVKKSILFKYIHFTQFSPLMNKHNYWNSQQLQLYFKSRCNRQMVTFLNDKIVKVSVLTSI